MSVWHEVGAGHLVQVIDREPGGRCNLLWEHDCPPGYRLSPSGPAVVRHRVSGTDSHWTVVADEPLHLVPSLHCDPGRGGCGAHGFVHAGAWSGA